MDLGIGRGPVSNLDSIKRAHKKMGPNLAGFQYSFFSRNPKRLCFQLTSIFPRWTSRIGSPPPAVRIKALRANHIPRFQTDSVRSSAGRQNATPLDVSAGRQIGGNYHLPNPAPGQEIDPASLKIQPGSVVPAKVRSSQCGSDCKKTPRVTSRDLLRGPG